MNDLVTVPGLMIEAASTWPGYEAAGIIVSILALLATLCLFGAIFRQTRLQIKSVNLQSKELDLYKKQLENAESDFDRRNKIITFEIVDEFSKIRNERIWRQHVSIIRNANTNDKDLMVMENQYKKEENKLEIHKILQKCENFCLKYSVLKLDLDVIDEVMGIELYDIFRNTVVKDIIKESQIIYAKDAYSNILSFYSILEQKQKDKGRM